MVRVFGLSPDSAGCPFDCLNLDFEARSKSRFKAALMTTREEIGVVLPRGMLLRGGSLLVDESGDYIEVVAADEPLVRIKGLPLELMRAAYHLGNRHVRLEIRQEFIQIRDDPVLSEMLIHLGLKPERVSSPFEPEWGAYGGGHQHGHDESFAEDYALAQAAFRAHVKRASES